MEILRACNISDERVTELAAAQEAELRHAGFQAVVEELTDAGLTLPEIFCVWDNLVTLPGRHRRTRRDPV
ncbi:MAG: hypothetical protein R2704_18540 [Microthrixaceae bacterium]